MQKAAESQNHKIEIAENINQKVQKKTAIIFASKF